MKMKAETLRKKNNYMNSIFRAFLCMALALTGFMGLLYSFFSFHVLKSNEIKANQKLLTQVSSSVDTILTYVDTVMFTFSGDRKFRNFNRYYKQMDIDSLLTVSDQIADILAGNSYIHSICIWYPAEEQVYVSNCGVLPVSQYFDEKFLRSCTGFYTGISPAYPRTVFDTFRQSPVTLMSLTRPLQYVNGEPESVLIINLDTSFFSDIFNSIAGGEEAYFALNADRTVVTSSDNCADYRSYFEEIRRTLPETGNTVFAMDSGKFLISCATSPDTGWSFYSITSTSVIYKELPVLTAFSVLILVIGTCAAIAYSGFISRHLTAPVVSVAGLLSQHGKPDPDPLRQIETGIHALKSENKNIQESLRESIPILKNNFVISLLSGFITAPDEIEKSLSYFGFPIDKSRQVFAVILKIDEINPSTGERYLPLQIHSFTTMVLNLLEAAFSDPARYLICNSYDGEITLIAADAGDEGMSAVAETLGSLFDDQRKYIGTISVGSVEENIFHISASYRNARKAMAFGFLSSTQIIRYADISDFSNSSSDMEGYPYRLEEALIASMRTNTVSNADESLKKLLNAILSGTEGHKSRRSYFLLRLFDVLLKYTYEANLPREEINETDLCAELLSLPEARLYSWFHEYIESVIMRILYRRINTENLLSERVKQYIEQNYEEDISISDLAGIFLFSPAHLSRLFHEETGGSIRQYLIKVRMTRACELLKDPSHKIADVGRLTGYPNPHGFLKQFKNYTGMTPSEYRRNYSR